MGRVSTGYHIIQYVPCSGLPSPGVRVLPGSPSTQGRGMWGCCHCRVLVSTPTHYSYPIHLVIRSGRLYREYTVRLRKQILEPPLDLLADFSLLDKPHGD